MSETGKRVKIKDITRVFLAIACLLFVVFFYSYVEGEEIHHECQGENCPICEMLSACNDTVKHMAEPAPAAIIIGQVSEEQELSITTDIMVPDRSLVSFKVRLND